MENPQAINRFFIALLITFTLVVIGYSIYLRDFSILLWWTCIIILFFALCRLFAFFNIIVFAPVFGLISKLVRKKSTKTGELDKK